MRVDERTGLDENQPGLPVSCAVQLLQETGMELWAIDEITHDGQFRHA